MNLVRKILAVLIFSSSITFLAYAQDGAQLKKELAEIKQGLESNLYDSEKRLTRLINEQRESPEFTSELKTINELADKVVAKIKGKETARSSVKPLQDKLKLYKKQPDPPANILEAIDNMEQKLNEENEKYKKQFGIDLDKDDGAADTEFMNAYEILKKGAPLKKSPPQGQMEQKEQKAPEVKRDVPFSQRLYDKKDLIKAGGGDGTEEAVEKALGWLARHQSSDGSWSSDKFASNCSDGKKCSGTGLDEFSTGVSGLALLAFLAHGFTQLDGEHKEVVKKGLGWLISMQDFEGCIGKIEQKYMYNHAIATMALAEAYGMTKEEWLLAPAKKAVDYLISAQNPCKGWRYTYRCNENDTSITGWCFMALKSANEAGIDSDFGNAYAGTLKWIKEVTDEENNYRVGYTAKGTGKVALRGINDAWSDHDALTAIGMEIRMYSEKNKSSKAVKGGVERLIMPTATNRNGNLRIVNLPEWDNSGKEKQIDFYHWYYGTLAMFKYDGPNGANWKKWNTALKKALLPNQRSGGCLDGSWDPEVDRWGGESGRVYATAINALTLEVYYRYK